MSQLQCEKNRGCYRLDNHAGECRPKKGQSLDGRALAPTKRNDALFEEHLRQAAFLKQEWQDQVYGPAAKAKIQWFMASMASDSPVGQALHLLIGSQYRLEAAEAKRVAEKKTAKEARRAAWEQLNGQLAHNRSKK